MSTPTIVNQKELDKANAIFWNEACGTHLANRTNTVNDYKSFDKAYFKQYPFLKRYLDKFSGDVLEIGTGYGTVATYLDKKCYYYACDIAARPIEILKERGLTNFNFSWQQSILDLSHKYVGFDGVVSIGCLHHTGNIPRSIKKIYRLLIPGGRALIMLYNADAKRPAVDIDTKGNKAPHIEYTSLSDLPGLFDNFSEWAAQVENGQNKDIYIEAVK